MGDELDLDVIEARAAAAVPGWSRPGWSRRAYADAAFIAHARTDIPALVAEVRRLREERDAVREEGRRENLASVVAWLRRGIKRHPQPGVLADLACLLESNGAPVGPDDAP